MKNPKIYFFGYLFIILIGSSIPGKSVPNIVVLTWDKLLHFFEYLVFGLLGYRSYFYVKYPKTFVTILGIIFGCFDEIWQIIIPGRDSNIYDILADTLGVIFGTILSMFIFKKQNDKYNLY